jgi:hypothetical protein
MTGTPEPFRARPSIAQCERAEARHGPWCDDTPHLGRTGTCPTVDGDVISP